MWLIVDDSWISDVCRHCLSFMTAWIWIIICGWDKTYFRQCRCLDPNGGLAIAWFVIHNLALTMYLQDGKCANCIHHILGCVCIVTWHNSCRDTSAKTEHANHAFTCAETPQRLQTFQHLYARENNIFKICLDISLRSDLGEMKSTQVSKAARRKEPVFNLD